jgi:hypothetical protein
MWKISLGPHLFDYGYGPFRWVCLSGKDEDLDLTDAMAMRCIDPKRRYQDKDNYDWIKNAKANHLVVGTKARILISGCQRPLENRSWPLMKWYVINRSVRSCWDVITTIPAEPIHLLEKHPISKMAVISWPIWPP